MLQHVGMLDVLLALNAAVATFFRSSTDTAFEVLALRRQVAVLKRKRRAVEATSGMLSTWDLHGQRCKHLSAG